MRKEVRKHDGYETDSRADNANNSSVNRERESRLHRHRESVQNVQSNLRADSNYRIRVKQALSKAI